MFLSEISEEEKIHLDMELRNLIYQLINSYPYCVDMYYKFKKFKFKNMILSYTKNSFKFKGTGATVIVSDFIGPSFCRITASSDVACYSKYFLLGLVCDQLKITSRDDLNKLFSVIRLETINTI